jgi:hypothetical protein
MYNETGGLVNSTVRATKKNLHILLFVVVLAACGVSVTSPTVVYMPVEFDQLKTEELLRSIDLMLLQKDILSHFPSAVENDVGVFLSATSF